MARLRLNVRFVGNAQTRKASTEEIKTSYENFARVILNEVALATAEDSYRKARATLVQSVKSAVQREIDQMMRMIQKFVTQPGRAKGPSGSLTFADKNLADQTRALIGRGSPSFQLGDSNAKWAERNVDYMKRKAQRGYGDSWWKNTGQLLRDISVADFGPVVVRFTRNQSQLSRVASREKVAGSTGRINVTASGRRGRISANYEVGRLEVATFGKITPDMLPSLASGNVRDVTPHGRVNLPSLIQNEDVRNKLSQLSTGEGGATRQYRPVLEPFVSYYLTRAIPNAVFNRAEKLIEASGR